MDTHVRTIAEEAARLLLQRFGKQHPDWRDEQTPLDAIAEPHANGLRFLAASGSTKDIEVAVTT